MYATIQEVRLVVARAPSQLRGSAASLGDDQIALALEQAQAEIDAKLRNRYVVPFPEPVPELVRSLTIDIAAYRSGLTFYQEKDLKDTDPIARRYKKACCLLDDIASGMVVLNTDGSERTDPSTAWFGEPVDPSGGGWLSGEFIDKSWC